MIDLYIFLGAIIGVVGVFIFLIKRSEEKGKADLRANYMEAEIDLRKKMADIDAAPDVDNPFDKL